MVKIRGRVEMREPFVVTRRVRGRGPGKTVLDFSGADPAAFYGRACVEVKGRGTLENLEVIGVRGALAPVVSVDDGAPGIRVRRVRASNSEYACFRILRGEGVVVRDLIAWDDSSAIGYNYGMVLVEARSAVVLRSRLHATRHGCAMSADTEDCRVIECNLSSSSIAAADFHKGVRRCSYENSVIQNGITFGGEGNRVSGCEIGPDDYGRAVYFHNLGDLDHVLEGCSLYGDGGDYGLVLWDRGEDETPTGGTLRINDCRIEANKRAVFLRNRYESSVSFRMIGCEVIGTLASQISSMGVSTRWERAELREGGIWGGFLVGAHADTVVDTAPRRDEEDEPRRVEEPAVARRRQGEGGSSSPEEVRGRRRPQRG